MPRRRPDPDGGAPRLEDEMDNWPFRPASDAEIRAAFEEYKRTGIIKGEVYLRDDPTPKQTTASVSVTRARRYASGMRLLDIANEDGVSSSSVRESLKTALRWALGSVELGSQLPTGCVWAQRSENRAVGSPEWYAAGEVTRQSIAWAVAVLDSPEIRPSVCPTCGRAL